MRELSLNVLDITQNSISAGATCITVQIDENLDTDRLRITVLDNGRGMTESQVKSVVDPFYTTRTTRPVGLGIPLFKMEAEMTGGSFQIFSQSGKGTSLTAEFIPSHIDMIPLGDMTATMLPLITGNENLNFRYTRRRISGGVTKEFTLNTQEVKEILGSEVSLGSPEVVLWLRDFLNENTNEILN